MKAFESLYTKYEDEASTLSQDQLKTIIADLKSYEDVVDDDDLGEYVDVFKQYLKEPAAPPVNPQQQRRKAFDSLYETYAGNDQLTQDQLKTIIADLKSYEDVVPKEDLQEYLDEFQELLDDQDDQDDQKLPFLPPKPLPDDSVPDDSVPDDSKGLDDDDGDDEEYVPTASELAEARRRQERFDRKRQAQFDRAVLGDGFTMPTRFTRASRVGAGQEIVYDPLDALLPIGIRNVRAKPQYRLDDASLARPGGYVNPNVANWYYENSFQKKVKKSWASENMPWLFGPEGLYPNIYDCPDECLVDPNCECP